jgi:hypothetical protein
MALVVACGLIFWSAGAIRDAFHPANNWARQYRRGDRPQRWEAVDNLARLAPDEARHGLPTFILALGDEDEEIASIAASSVARGAQSALAAGNPGAAEQGMAALVETVRTERRPDVRLAAIADLNFYVQAANLPGVAAPVTEVLGIALADQDERIRARAAKAIGATKRAGPMALPLVKALGDPSAAVREEAAQALIGADQEVDRVAVALLRATEDDEPKVRQAAGVALHNLRVGSAPRAVAMVPEVVSVLEKSSDRDTLCYAAALLGMIGPDARPAVPVLLRALDGPVGPPPEVGSLAMARAGGPAYWHPPGQAALALAMIVPGTPQEAEVAEALLAVLRDDPEDLKRAMAAAALSRFGPPIAEKAFPLVVKILEADPRAGTPLGYYLYELIGRTTARSPVQAQAQALLTAGLDSADQATRARCARMLGLYEAAAAPALDRLKVLAKSDPDEFVRTRAQESVDLIEAATATTAAK